MSGENTVDKKKPNWRGARDSNPDLRERKIKATKRIHFYLNLVFTNGPIRRDTRYHCANPPFRSWSGKFTLKLRYIRRYDDLETFRLLIRCWTKSQFNQSYYLSNNDTIYQSKLITIYLSEKLELVVNFGVFAWNLVSTLMSSEDPNPQPVATQRLVLVA